MKNIKNGAVIFPNKFKGGISCLAMHILHYHLNKYKDIDCKMFFIENYHEIRNYDAIIITLQYENDYFNAIKIIKELKPKNPNAIFIGGGPCAISNPFPLSKFFDAFVVGEIEGTEVMYNLITRNFDEIKEGVYFPNREGKIKRIYPKKLTIEDYPINQITHESGAYGKAFLLEIGRGCPRRCKFCMARSIYFPPRFRKLDDLIYLVDKGLEYTKVNKVALIAPSVGDYKYILDLCQHLNEKGVQISPSSLRADTITDELLNLLKLKTLTIAPEAGSERLRKIIKKDISEEHILNAVELAKEHGIDKIKLYFMVGIVDEKDEDVEEIINLTKKIKENIRKVEVSINPMVPKPRTPFERECFDLTAKNKIKYIEKNLKKIGVSVEGENFNSMIAQCILCRGGEELGNILENSEKPIRLIKNIKNAGLLDKYLGRIEGKLPWERIEL